MSSSGEKSQRRGGRRRWWALLSVALLLVGARIALPHVAKPYLEEQLSALIAGSVKVADLRFSLLEGIAGATGLEVVGEGESTPLIQLDDLEINLSWRELLSQQVRLEKITLTQPSIDVQRLLDGDLNLTKLSAPDGEATIDDKASDDQGGEASSWAVGIDEIVLRSGGISFLDRLVGADKAIALEISTFDVTRAEIVGDLYEAPTHFDVVATLAGAPLKVTGDVTIGERIDLTVDIEGEQVPLSLAQGYLDLGWTRIGGSLDLDLHYELSGEEVSRVEGSAALNDAEIHVGELTEPALAASIEVDLEAVDLVAQNAEVKSIAITKGSVVVRPNGENPLPLLAAGKSANKDKGDGSEAGDAGNAAAANDGQGDGDSTGWTWSVSQARVDGYTATVQGVDKTIPFALTARASALSSETGATFPINIALSDEAAKVALKGTAGIAPVVADVQVDWQEVDLPRWLALVEVEQAELLRKAVSTGDLKIDLADGGAVEVSGAARVENLDVGDGGEDFAVRAERVALALAHIGMPASGSALDVRIDEIDINEPDLKLSLEDSGLVLPAAATGEGDVAVAADGKRESSSSSSTSSSSGDAKIEIAKVRVGAGRLTLHDRTVRPPTTIKLESIEVDGREIVPAGPSADNFHLRFSEPGGGSFDSKLSLRDGAGAAKIGIKAWTLPALSAYAEKYAGYTLKQGGLSLDSDIKLKPDGVDSANALSLSQLSVGNQDNDFFQQQMGIPLSLALELLRDEKGDIHLDLPFRSGTVTSQVALVELMAKTLRTVLLSTLKSPLKLLGAATLKGGKIAGFGVDPVPFAVGQTRLEANAAKKLGETLSQRSGLQVAVRGVVTQADVAAMEQVSGSSPGKEEIATLANARADAVRSALREEHGIHASRLALTRSVGRVSDGEPRVEVEIGGGGFLR